MRDQDFITEISQPIEKAVEEIAELRNESNENVEKIIDAVEDIDFSDVVVAINTQNNTQKRTLKAIESLPDTSGLLEEIKTAIDKKELVVNIGETVIETKNVVEAIKNLQKEITKPKKKSGKHKEKMEVLSNLLTKKDLSSLEAFSKEISSGIKDIPKSFTDDISILSEWLKVIAEKESVSLPRDKNGIPYFTPTVVGGGGSGGLTPDESSALLSISSKQDALLANYATKFVTVQGITYVGEAQAGSATESPVWRIQRIDNESVTWANGDTEFDKVWDDYLTLTYS